MIGQWPQVSQNSTKANFYFNNNISQQESNPGALGPLRPIMNLTLKRC